MSNNALTEEDIRKLLDGLEERIIKLQKDRDDSMESDRVYAEERRLQRILKIIGWGSGIGTVVGLIWISWPIL